MHVALWTTCLAVPVPTIHVCPHPPPSENHCVPSCIRLCQHTPGKPFPSRAAWSRYQTLSLLNPSPLILRNRRVGERRWDFENCRVDSLFSFVQWENDESHSQQEPNRWCRWVFPGALEGREFQSALDGFTCTQCFPKSVAMMQKCPRELHCYYSFLRCRNYCLHCSFTRSLVCPYLCSRHWCAEWICNVKHGAACLQLQIHRKVENICGLSIKN